MRTIFSIGEIANYCNVIKSGDKDYTISRHTIIQQSLYLMFGTNQGVNASMVKRERLSAFELRVLDEKRRERGRVIIILLFCPLLCGKKFLS